MKLFVCDLDLTESGDDLDLKVTEGDWIKVKFAIHVLSREI